MQASANYGFNKPELTDSPPDISVVSASIEAIDGVIKTVETAAAAKIPNSLATAADQALVSTGAGAWAVKTLAQVKTWLGLGSAAYTDSTAYATAAQGTLAVNAAPASDLAAHKADNVYQIAGGTATAIALTIGEALSDGLPVNFKCASNNSAVATTINGKPFYKPGGTSAPNLIAGKYYTAVYNTAGACFFIKASAEGTAVAGNVLAGTTFSNDSDTGIVGTMPSKVGTATILTPGTADQAIPAGYYGGVVGDGKVPGDANLLAANIRAGISIFGVTGSLAMIGLYYYCVGSALSVARYQLAGTTVGNYAIFAGGYANGSVFSNAVDAYDMLLVKTTPTALNTGRCELAAATVGNYALFGGGRTSVYTPSKVVDAYDNSLVHTIPTSLSGTGKYATSATTIGNYALFAGGGTGNGTYSAVVDAYDASLVRTSPTVLSLARCNLVATTVGNYALFGGGTNGSTKSAVVEAYDTSLTMTTPTVLSQIRTNLACARVENYALFGGGMSSSVSSIVDAYDSSLTRTTPTVLSLSRKDLAGASAGNYALFGGGSVPATTYKSNVDAYDNSLVKVPSVAPLSNDRDELAGVGLGKYIIFAGGTNSNGMSDVVDIYATQS